MTLSKETRLAFLVVRTLLEGWNDPRDGREDPVTALMTVFHAREDVFGRDEYFVVAAAEYMRLSFLNDGVRDQLPDNLGAFLAASREYVVPMLRACLTVDRTHIGPVRRQDLVDRDIPKFGFLPEGPISPRTLEILVRVFALRDLLHPQRWYAIEEYASRILATGLVSKQIADRARLFLTSGEVGSRHPAADFLSGLSRAQPDIADRMRAVAALCTSV